MPLDNLTAITTLAAELVTLIGVVTPMIITVRKVANGTRCQLRSEMLRIYYHNREREKIRQYEFENFIALYEAYKALKGNSFVDKIYKEVNSWEVIT
jgi:hypothetical protein